MTKTKALKNFISKFLGYDANGNSVTSVLADATANADGGGKSPIYTEENVIAQNLEIANASCWLETTIDTGEQVFHYHQPIIPLNIEFKSGDSFELVGSRFSAVMPSETGAHNIKWECNGMYYPATARVQDLPWLPVKEGHDTINALSVSFGAMGLVSNYDGLLDSIKGLFYGTNPNNAYLEVIKNAKTLFIGDYIGGNVPFCSERVTIIKTN